jgi:hypothetical protein
MTGQKRTRRKMVLCIAEKGEVNAAEGIALMKSYVQSRQEVIGKSGKT